MGYAIAEELAQRGARVHLVSGPVSLTPKHSGIALHSVVSAREMADACIALFPSVSIAILTAAVADFTPAHPCERKIKRAAQQWQPAFVPTPDIARTLGSAKQAGQMLVGFALEDANEMDNAIGKLHSKNLDMIVLNSLNDTGAGFGLPTNKVSIIERNGSIAHFSLKPKIQVARDIVDKVEQMVC